MKYVLRVLAAVCILITSASVPFATPQYDTIWTYYDGPDFATANIVGQKFEMCSGTWRTGTTSGDYNITYGMDCSNNTISCQATESQYECGNCNDTIDNDGDGKWDAWDPDCWP